MGGSKSAERLILVCGADGPAGTAAISALRRTGALVLAGGTDHGVLAGLAQDGVVPLTLRAGDPQTMRIALAIAMDRFGRLDEVLVLDGLGTEPDGPAGVAARLDALVGWTGGLTKTKLKPPVVLRVALASEVPHGDLARAWGVVADAAVSTWVAGQIGALAERGLLAHVLRVPANASAVDWASSLLEGQPQGPLQGRLRGLARRLREGRRGRRSP